MSDKQFSEACERNKAPILAVLGKVFSEKKHVLEIGSGTGQHAVFFGKHLPQLTWQTSDLQQNHRSITAWQKEAGLANVLPPIELDVSRDYPQYWPQQRFDAIFSANTCHIMSWQDVKGMMKGIGHILQPDGLLCIYGPFNYNGQFTSASNEQFDAYLKSQSEHMGIRDREEVNRLAQEQGLSLMDDYAMPANNRLLVWKRTTSLD